MPYEDTWAVRSGEEEDKGRSGGSPQLPEEEKRRGRCRSLLPGHPCQDVQEWQKAAPKRFRLGDATH